MTERTFLVIFMLFRVGVAVGASPRTCPESAEIDQQSSVSYVFREINRIFPVQADVFWPGLTFGQGTEIA